MRKGSASLLRIRVEIEDELSALDRLGVEHDSMKSHRDEPFLSRSRASVLHDLYTGFERIFIRIADEIGGGIPKSDQWHRELLRDMALEMPELRPQVISRKLHDSLLPYLRFRHLFRNVYGFVLDADKLDALDAGFPEVLGQFQQEIRAFLSWLDAEISRQPK
jgi:hypothetical protein